MAVHWLRFRASNSGGMDSIPYQGTKIPSCHGAWPKDKKKKKDGIGNGAVKLFKEVDFVIPNEEDKRKIGDYVVLNSMKIGYKEIVIGEDINAFEGQRYLCCFVEHNAIFEHYNEAITFSSKESTDEYIDSAIARNIQHSLRYYQDGGHFRHLAELYDKNELTSAINRVVEDINHRFTMEVLTRDFLSGDLGISKRNLRRDRNHPTNVLDLVNEEAFTKGLRRALDILNKNERRVQITDSHRTEIKEYLDLLDLTVDIPTEFIPAKNEKLYKTAITQPGMRYAQADALLRQLLLDQEMQNLSALERAWVLERILNEIKGRMMEDIVLLETTKSCSSKSVFRLQFPIGEFDMVIVDPITITGEIYEIKHSKEVVSEQYKNLIQQDKLDATEFRFGRITRKAVIYRGESKMDGEIEYLNVEEYLREL